MKKPFYVPTIDMSLKFEVAMGWKTLSQAKSELCKANLLMPGSSLEDVKQKLVNASMPKPEWQKQQIAMRKWAEKAFKDGTINQNVYEMMIG